ncbi:hypothetical protein [Thermococcus sp. Bubb.Bath]|nr:hypothetical protein [Thermococcus sp. Bubb.Bath]
MWKKALALLFGFLILGLTVSSASVVASVVQPVKPPAGDVGIPPGVNQG